ncbi:Ubinuclein-2 [Camellia lanceoleosa]|uniref:Ubinuclein-2 n=1 Tax=Camellia lanceoleosa TaxID=1840588 RepID=A0ACC0HHK6_9ERIC|nr:Ubinuclein-2 [Camellia lanceoleosa]
MGRDLFPTNVADDCEPRTQRGQWWQSDGSDNLTAVVLDRCGSAFSQQTLQTIANHKGRSTSSPINNINYINIINISKCKLMQKNVKPNKHVKVGKKVPGKSVPLVGKNTTGHSHILALPSVHHEDMKFQNQMNSSVICAKKNSAETKTLLDPSPPSKVPNGDASLSIPEEKDIDKQKTRMASSKYQGDKLKDGGEFSDPSVQRCHGKSSYTQSKSQPGKLLNNVNESNQSIRGEKDKIRERHDLNVSEGKYPMQTVAPLMQRKKGLNVRPKSTMLEKAIKELEKMVAESKPPTMEVQDADISSQAIKRRLPHEVKQKLAKVARLAQANHGKISMEMVNRLMSIVGHMVQLRTLKVFTFGGELMFDSLINVASFSC